MNLIFLGPPGSGKGTQSKILTEKYNLVQLSTGDMLRSAIEEKTTIGLQAQEILRTGGLVSDDLVNQIVFECLLDQDSLNGFILDGYPRTLNQAQALKEFLANKNMKLDAVLELVVDYEMLVDRIKNRAQESAMQGKAARSDDNVETFQKRLIEYGEKTLPLSKFYEQEHLLKKIDGMRPVEIVGQEIDALLQALA